MYHFSSFVTAKIHACRSCQCLTIWVVPIGWCPSLSLGSPWHLVCRSCQCLIIWVVHLGIFTLASCTYKLSVSDHLSCAFWHIHLSILATCKCISCQCLTILVVPIGWCPSLSLGSPWHLVCRSCQCLTIWVLLVILASSPWHFGILYVEVVSVWTFEFSFASWHLHLGILYVEVVSVWPFEFSLASSPWYLGILCPSLSLGFPWHPGTFLKTGKNYSWKFMFLMVPLRSQIVGEASALGHHSFDWYWHNAVLLLLGIFVPR